VTSDATPEAVTPGRRGADIAFGWRLIDALIATRSALRLERFERARRYLLLVPALALLTLLAWGLGDLAWKSFHTFDSYTQEAGGLSFAQYERLLTGATAEAYRTVIIRTTLVSIVVTVTAVGLALPVAYLIVRLASSSLRMLVLLLVLVPFLMGEVVRAFGWLLLLGRDGALAWATGLAGADPPQLIGSVFGIWLGSLQVLTPIAALILLPAMKRVDPDLERAARTLGARPWQTWRCIVLPLCRSGIAGASAVVFTLSMTEFAIPEVLGAGRKPFVANSIDQMFFLQNNTYLGSAYALLLLIGVALVVFGIMFVGRRGQA
jgi:putative spermidine/putrescine transport system permease protein